MFKSNMRMHFFLTSANAMALPVISVAELTPAVSESWLHQRRGPPVGRPG